MTGKAVHWLSKLRAWLIMGFLLAALSVVNLFLGCDLDKEDPKPLYGVPPDDYLAPDLDEPSDIYVDQTAPDQMQTYYGPMPVDIVEDNQVKPLYGPVIEEIVPQDAGVDDVQELPDASQPDQMQTFYGPMPVDIVEGDAPDPQLDVNQTWYGPPPQEDIAQPVDDVAEDVSHDAVDKEVMFYYGPVPYYGSQEAPE
jgi:hypothetical protein